MNRIQQFDVLIVYADDVALSASSIDPTVTSPFAASSSYANYNTSYAYFLSTCTKYNFKAAFTTTADIVSEGTCKSYWTYNDKSWDKVKQLCYAPLIFDKCSPINPSRIAERVLLFSEAVVPFNDCYLTDLFNDKYKTYKELEEYMIPTVRVDRESIKSSLEQLQGIVKSHPHKDDFSRGIIVKDRNGAGGEHIYKVTSQYVFQIQKILEANKTIQFVIQPFVHFDQGYSYAGEKSLADVRLIYMKKKLVQSYIRVAKPNEFRCNEHQGGMVTYLTKKEIPQNVLQHANRIIHSLRSHTSLYALDFIISNSGTVYFMEGNCGPGLNWTPSKKIDEQKSKQLIETIVEELSLRIAQLRLYSTPRFQRTTSLR